MADLLDFIPVFASQTEDIIYARMVTWANEGLTTSDDRWVDTREGSIFWTLAKPGSREIARLYDVAGTEVPASGHVLYAWGDYLDDLAGVLDIQRLAATQAQGIVRFTGAAGTLVSAGSVVSVVATDPDATVPEFSADSGSTIPAALAAPATPTGTPSISGGTLGTNTYFYVVTARDLIGETLPSAQRSVAVVGPTGSVVLDWPDVAGAAGYSVYRGTVTGGPYAHLANPTLSTYTDVGTATTVPSAPGANTTGGAIDLPVTAVDTGVDGNVAGNSITVAVTPLSGVTAINNAGATQGGTEPETDDALRTRVQQSFKPRGPGTIFDYVRWASAYDGVGRVAVIPIWAGPGTVLVIVTDADGNPVSAGTVATVQAGLDPIAGKGHGVAPIGHVVTVRTPTQFNITVSATVEFEPGYDLDGAAGATSLRAELNDAITTYINAVPSGGEVVLAQVAARIADHQGVHDVGSVLLNGAAANITISSDPSQVPNTTTITLTAGTL